MSFVAISSLFIGRTISKAAFLPFKASCFELCVVLMAVVNVKPRYTYLLTISIRSLPRYHFSSLARKKSPFLKTIAFVLDVLLCFACLYVLEIRIRNFSILASRLTKAPFDHVNHEETNKRTNKQANKTCLLQKQHWCTHKAYWGVHATTKIISKTLYRFYSQQWSIACIFLRANRAIYACLCLSFTKRLPETINKGNQSITLDRQGKQRQRPDLPTVALTWYASKFKAFNSRGPGLLVGGAPDSWSKGCEFEFRQERRDNFFFLES